MSAFQICLSVVLFFTALGFLTGVGEIFAFAIVFGVILPACDRTKPNFDD